MTGGNVPHDRLSDWLILGITRTQQLRQCLRRTQIKLNNLSPAFVIFYTWQEGVSSLYKPGSPLEGRGCPPMEIYVCYSVTSIAHDGVPFRWNIRIFSLGRKTIFETIIWMKTWLYANERFSERQSPIPRPCNPRPPWRCQYWSIKSHGQ